VFDVFSVATALHPHLSGPFIFLRPWACSPSSIKHEKYWFIYYLPSIPHVLTPVDICFTLKLKIHFSHA